jgi:hypothetical protein
MRSWLGRAVVWWAVWGVALSGAAQDAPASTGTLRVAVLRATQGDAGAAADAVDGALLRDLAAIAGIDDPSVSPIDYAEIQLTVGCSDEGRDCLVSIARMTQVDAVVVRKLAALSGRATLELVYLDATATDLPARVQESAEGAGAAERLEAAVPVLVRRLFGIPEAPMAQAEPGAAATTAPGQDRAGAQREQAGEGGGVSALTFIALAAGAGALGAGIAFGLGAQSTFDEYKGLRVRDEDDARRANAKFDSAKSQGMIATVLIPAGAAVLALGATLLVLDLSDGGGGEHEIALQPLPGGALLSLRGTTGGL